MYRASSGLGAFSLTRALTPPQWLRDAITQHVGAAVSGTTLSIPTATGTITFDLSDPKQWAAIGNMLKGVKITRASDTPQVSNAGVVGSIPGGWMTIALIGLGAFLFFKGRR